MSDGSPGPEQPAGRPHSPILTRNFVLGVLNGTLFMSTTRLVDPGALLSLLILRLTDSPQMIGVMAFASSLGWFWPAVFVANRAGNRPRKLSIYRDMAVVRIILLWVAAFVTFSRLAEGAPVLLFWLLALTAFGQNSASGIAYVPFMEVVGKSVAPEHRGLFLGLRFSSAELLGIGVAALAGYFLSDASGLRYPANFGWMLSLAALLQSASMIMFILIREPKGAVESRRFSFPVFLTRGIRFFRRDRSLRNFTALRLMNSFASMSMPFMAAFATQELGVADSTIGYFMGVAAGGALIANLVWGRVGDRRGNRVVMIAFAALSIIPAVVSLAAATLPASRVALPVLGAPDLRVVLVGVVFLLGGLTGPGRQFGEANYILDLAPERRRSAYLGISHTLSAPQTLVPILAGWVAEDASYAILFGATAIFAALTTALAITGLHEPRKAALV